MPASAGPAPPLRAATGTSTRRPSLWSAVISRATSSTDGAQVTGGGGATPGVSVVTLICRPSRPAPGPGPADALAGTDVHHRKHSGRRRCLSIGNSTAAEEGGGGIPRGGVGIADLAGIVRVLAHLAGVHVQAHPADGVHHTALVLVGGRAEQLPAARRGGHLQSGVRAIRVPLGIPGLLDDDPPHPGSPA